MTMGTSNVPRDFLVYWKPTTALTSLRKGALLEHSGSEQYRRVGPGDTVWMVTCQDGLLHLLGRIIVGRVTNQIEAERLLGRNDLWKATHHILAAKHTAEVIRNVAINHLAAELEFQSASGRDRLTVTDGRVKGQQLQAMRVLKPHSAALLAAALRGDSSSKSKKSTRSSHKNPPGGSPPITSIEKRSENTKKFKSDLKRPLVTQPALLTTLSRLQQAGLKSDDLLRRQYRNSDRSEAPLSGLCYVLSECMFHLFPGTFTPYRINWGGGRTHWFLRLADGVIFDSTNHKAAECCDPDDYASARRVGFLTKLPSKRACVLLERAKLDLPE